MTTKFVNQACFRDPGSRAVVEDWSDCCRGHDNLDAAILCGDSAKKLSGDVFPHLTGLIAAIQKHKTVLAVMDMRIIKRVTTLKEDTIEEHLDVLTPVTPKKATP